MISDGAIYSAVSKKQSGMKIEDALNLLDPDEVATRLEGILRAAGVEFEGRLEWPTYVSFPDGKRFVGTLYVDTNGLDPAWKHPKQ
jgi:hypothetical protein